MNQWIKRRTFIKNTILVILIMLTMNTAFAAATAMKISVNSDDGVSLKSTFKTIDLDSKYLSVTDLGQLVLKTPDMDQEITLGSLQNRIMVNLLKDKTDRDLNLITCVHMGCFPIPSYVSTHYVDLELKTESGKIVCYQSYDDLIIGGGFSGLTSKWSMGHCQ